MTTPKPGNEARMHLGRANRAAIHVMLCRAAAGGMNVSRAVAIVADTTDAVGRELAEAATARASLDVTEEAERVVGREEIPTAILIVTLEAAREIFAASHPSVAAGLDKQPTSGSVRCVSVAL